MSGATKSMPAPAPSSSGASLSRLLEPEPGARLGRYELLFRIANGGMAQVWAAVQNADLGIRKVVALKFIRPDYASDVSVRRMFLEEARVASKIRHANVVEIVDVGEEGTLAYQVMPLIDGDSLLGLQNHQAARTGSKSIPVAVAVRIVVDVLRGLHAAHELTDEAGIHLALVHRDVSPHNILVGLDGVARIADFGIAKALGRLADETDFGQLKGKLGYMAPEQLLHGQVDRRSDLFATGVVLWEIVTGSRLFGGVEPLEHIVRRRELQRVDDPRERVPTLPEWLARTTMRALERDPEARFATAEEMADALEEGSQALQPSLSARSVASFVADLTEDALSERRRRLLEGMREVPRPASSTPAPRPTEEVTVTATVTRVDAPRLGGGDRWTRGARFLALGLAATAILSGTALAMRSAKHPEPEPPLAPSNAKASAAPPAALAPPDVPSASASASSLALAGEGPAPVAARPRTRVARPSSRPAAPAPPPARPAPPIDSSASSLRFGNPYAP